MIPTIIYKYRNWENENHKKIIQENNIWLSSPKNLNDPFDCQLPLVIDENEIKSEGFFQLLYEQAGNMEIAQAKWKEILEDPKEYFKQRESEFLEMYLSFGVLSLCESPTNYLLWSHYANCHKGFCIGFNTERIVKDIQGTFEKVIYQLDFPTFKFLGDPSDSFSKALATKHQEWGYEKEWRITKSFSANKEIKLNKNSIAEIYFGVKMDDYNKNAITGHLKEDIKSIKFFEMQLSKNSFSVEPKEIIIP